MQIENNGENIEVSKKYAKKITREEMDAGDNKADRKAIFNSMDTNNDGNLSTTELADAFSRLDADGDGKVTDAEINAAVDAIPNIKQAKKAEYIAYLKDMAAKNNSKAESETGNTYTVQLGEQYDDLIARILKSRGIDNPTDAQIKAAKKQFEADNEGAFTRNADGSVKWLLAGKQVFVRTGTTDDAKDYMKDRNNASEVMEDYTNWVKGGKKGFTYDVSKPNAFRETHKAESSTDSAVDISKIDDKALGDKKDKKEDYKKAAQKANDMLKQLSDKNNIKSISEPSAVGNNVMAFITLKDDSTISLTYVNGKLDRVGVFPKGEKIDVFMHPDNKLDMGHRDKDNKYISDVKMDNVIDFSKIEKMIPQDTRDKMAKMSKDESDLTARRKNYVDKNINGKNYDSAYEKGKKLYNQVQGLSRSNKTKEMLKEINKDNVFGIVRGFNDETKKGGSKQNIIEYLVDENDITGEDILHIIDSALAAAKEMGLEDTQEYKNMQTSQKYYANNKDVDVYTTAAGKKADGYLNALLDKMDSYLYLSSQ